MRFAERRIIHRVLNNEPTPNTQASVGSLSLLSLLFSEVHARSNLIAFTGFQVAEL